jgi:hypothetical protein
MQLLDEQLEGTFSWLGEKLDRRRALRRAAGLTGAIAGFGMAADVARATPSQCGDNFGRCGGCLCCCSYNGCQGSTGFYCGNTPSGCSKHSANWSACCNHYWLYAWYDCCFSSNSGGCCTPSQCSATCCQGGSGCRVYCNGGSCYCCSFRVIVAGGCN